MNEGELTAAVVDGVAMLNVLLVVVRLNTGLENGSVAMRVSLLCTVEMLGC